MDLWKQFSDWILLLLSGIGSVILYHYKRVNDSRKSEAEKLSNRLERLEKEYYRLDRMLAETSIEIKAIKEDIGYIRIGLDKILERL